MKIDEKSTVHSAVLILQGWESRWSGEPTEIERAAMTASSAAIGPRVFVRESGVVWIVTEQLVLGSSGDQIRATRRLRGADSKAWVVDQRMSRIARTLTKIPVRIPMIIIGIREEPSASPDQQRIQPSL
jgi:hypothetical protein